jgi:hypothetical protein
LPPKVLQDKGLEARHDSAANLRPGSIARIEDPEKMLPSSSAQLWEQQGIYAFFDLVDKPENRKKIQLWWTKWMKDKASKNVSF